MNYVPCTVLIICFCLTTPHLIESQNISSEQSLSGNETIASGSFSLGFFTPGNSNKYYIGIWYSWDDNHDVQKKRVVWVANRNVPISDSYSSALRLNGDGNLVLLLPNKSIVWSTHSHSNIINSTVGVLNPDGNFVLRNKFDHSRVIWQSFDHPTDTWLPGAKLGYNTLTSQAISLTSWTSPENPKAGPYSAKWGPFGKGPLSLWNGTSMYWATGNFILPEIQNSYLDLTSVTNANESYLMINSPSYVSFVLDSTGQLLLYSSSTLLWRNCSIANSCGDFSICNEKTAPFCSCLQGFKPKSPADWVSGDHRAGCKRESALQCHKGKKDIFLRIPDVQTQCEEIVRVNNTNQCELMCLSDCSCNAYVALKNHCHICTKQVTMLVQLEPQNGGVFYLRVAALDLRVDRPWIKESTKRLVLVVGMIVLFFTLGGIVFAILRTRKKSSSALEFSDDFLLLFKFHDLKKATNNFSDKIGEGGFGCVFRGTLPNSTDIAVKKLTSQMQSEKQFRAEVSTIGAIHHINLLRLRGFCIGISKRLLVYDYIHRGSLASHIFPKDPIFVLSWKTRYNIVIGIARGLAYLHENCSDCIIHCDIKPENILLDENYNPKVADFGLAKLLSRDFSRVLTTIRGTRGYLAPEWISGEPITPKVDVFSYGKLLFEIISGKRNMDMPHDKLHNYFPSVVANAVNRGEELKLLFEFETSGVQVEEQLTRACRVACWCIHDDEKYRPTMSQVVRILEGVQDVDVPPIPRFFQCLEDHHPSIAIDTPETGGNIDVKFPLTSSKSYYQTSSSSY